MADLPPLLSYLKQTIHGYAMGSVIVAEVRSVLFGAGLGRPEAFSFGEEAVEKGEQGWLRTCVETPKGPTVTAAGVERSAVCEGKV